MARLMSFYIIIPFFITVMKIGIEALEELIEHGQIFRVSEDEESD